MSFLFGCSHKNTSFPMTLRIRGANAAEGETYVVCLDCGREFPYSWEEMRIVRRVRPKTPPPSKVVSIQST